jgi:hypothetical protein
MTIPFGAGSGREGWGLGFALLLGFTPGPLLAAPYLVYASGGNQDHIQAAMTSRGFAFEVRNALNPVTAVDLATHEALGVGGAAGGFDLSGLDPAVLAAGVGGNRLLTSHDADYHTWAGSADAGDFLQRAVQFAGAAPGCGILAFPVFAADPFPYLPTEWGVTAAGRFNGETIDALTLAAGASGIYAGLTLADLSDWKQSYHSEFVGWGGEFEVFEVGVFEGRERVVTIGRTVAPVSITDAPGTALLFTVGLLGLAVWGSGRARVR